MWIIREKKFLGLATCWTRPWWKIWIPIYVLYLEHDETGERDVVDVCDDCKCHCDNYRVWFPFYKIRECLGFPLMTRKEWVNSKTESFNRKTNNKEGSHERATR